MRTYLPAVLSSVGSDVFERQIDRMFDEALRAPGTADQGWMPPCNVWEDGNGFYIEVALPGWDPKDITLEIENIENPVVTVKGERKDEGRSEGSYHVQEIDSGRFTRAFTLPTSVDPDKASATHKHGMLTITFPKREEAKCRQILIEQQ
jgi:HSP20 family protein